MFSRLVLSQSSQHTHSAILQTEKLTTSKTLVKAKQTVKFKSKKPNFNTVPLRTTHIHFGSQVTNHFEEIGIPLPLHER